MINVLKYIWQLPQNLLGVLYRIVVCATNIYAQEEFEIFIHPFKGGVTLGKYIFISNNLSEKTIRHEIGHTKQSLYLGPLYLLIIGIPSIIWAFLHSYILIFRQWKYSSFYTEKWANKLAGIE